MQQANGVQQGQAGRGRCAGGAVGINLAFVNSKGVDASLGRGFSACRGNPPATKQTNMRWGMQRRGSRVQTDAGRAEEAH